MRNTLIDALHENNKHKRTIATWQALERLSATIECLRLDEDRNNALVAMVKYSIETVESAGFTKGKAIAEREYNNDLRTLVQRLEAPDLVATFEEHLSTNE